MKRSKFSLSNYKLLTCDMGELVPIGLTEVLPGDSVQHATSLLLRVSPLLAPVMHPVQVRVHHWYVPHRIIWDGWENFITGGPDGEDETVHPTIDFGEAGVAEGSLADYLGLPPMADYGGAGVRAVNALPFRAYSLIWNEFYRDQDLQDPLDVFTGSGPDEVTNTVLQNVAWEKDYFTSARPWTQKGPEVTVPFGSFAPVQTTGAQVEFRNTADASVGANWGQIGSEYAIQGIDEEGRDLIFGDVTGLFTDLSSATAVGVNALREAFALQRYAEARARYGSRYTEYLRYLGVKSSDARLQRPEYLGGGKQTIQFSEVLQSSPDDTDPDTGVGVMRGHGIAAMRSNRYRRFFEEHGYIVTVLSVKPRTMYAQGLPRTWSRRTKEDYFQKELQHIGQQEVYNREIYLPGASPSGVFGYQDRYDEYRRTESGIAGQFRSTLAFWHYARLFGSAPTLNSDFIRSEPTKRVNAVQSEDVLWIMANHSMQARRLVAAKANSFIS